MQFLKRFRNSEVPAEYFLALNISDESVRAAVWTVEAGKTRVAALGRAAKWDGQNRESLLAAADQTLSPVSDGIKPEPSSVIFGLPESWVEKEAINQEKKTLLKYLGEELELKPMGFVTTDTALIAYLKIEEGTPLSAILLQLSSGEINLTLVKLGKIIGSELVGRSGDLGADTEEGLSRFNQVEALPARIILFNGAGDFEEDKQQLLSYDWEDKLPFIHFPKVESLSSEITTRAIALAGGNEAAQSIGIEIKAAVEPETSAGALGFVAGEDVAEKEPVTKVEAAEIVVKEKSKIKIKIKINWQPFLEKLTTLFSKLPRSKLPIIVGGGVAVLLIGLFLLYWYVPKAKVVLYLEPQRVNQELDLTLDPEASGVDAAAGVLPVSLVEKNVSGNTSAPVSGSKTIGDPARGGVTIYNKTAAIKTFAAGTMLLGPDNLAFSLDEETIVASRSSAVDQNENTIISPGKTEAKIAAANIGPASNLAADTRLTFKQFSEDDYYAKTSGLSGGTAESVPAVSEEDVAALEADLTAELIAQAKEQLEESLGQDQLVLEREEKLTLADKNWSAASGDPADELSLTGRLNFEGVVYRQAEFDQLLTEAIKTKIPENFVISEFAQVELKPLSGMILPVSYEAKLLPRLDFSEIKNNLRGRYPDRVGEYLLSLPQFVSADIKITPNLPQSLKTLPRVTKNINLEIKSAP